MKQVHRPVTAVLLVTASCAFSALAGTPVGKAAVGFSVGLDTKALLKANSLFLIRTQLDGAE